MKVEELAHVARWIAAGISIMVLNLESQAQSGQFDEAGDEANDEAIYVAMLGTRKHRLSGENPTVGVFYTRDFGETWEHTGWEQGKAFAVHIPNHFGGDTLWVAAGNGVHRSTDGGKSWRITTGWEVTEVQDVWTDPEEPSDVWAATPYGVYRSEDFGETWKHVGGGFASTVRNGLVGTEKGLFRIQEGRLHMESPLLTEPVRSIRRSPHDPQIWVAALQGAGVRISTDGARSFRPASLDGETIYEAEFHPVKPNVIYAGGWETGLLASSDLGRSWSRLESLDAKNIHGIAISRRNPAVIIVGSMDDGVFVTRDQGESWYKAAPEIFDQGQIWDVHVRGE